MGDDTAGARQIRWEFGQLTAAGAILFWFAPETVQPIVCDLPLAGQPSGLILGVSARGGLFFGSLGSVKGAKRVFSQLLDHAFDVIPALVLLSLAAGQNRHLTIVF